MLGTPDAVRPFGLLPRGVRADRRTHDDLLGIDDDLTALDADHEPVEAARCGPTSLLTDAVVLRPMARTFEPLRGLAPRHPAAQMNATLIQGDDAVLVPRDHCAVRRDVLRLRDRVGGIGVEVEAPLGD